MRVAVDQALQAALAALQHVGVPADSAGIQADLLIDADLCARPSHGLMRLPRVIDRVVHGVCDPVATGQHTWHGAMLEVDGENGLGPVVATRALDALVNKARVTGIAIASIRHNNHLGMLAWYARRVARGGHLLIAATTSEALVHPWGGGSAMLGTNPFALGVPTDEGPFVLDMATSLVSMGQIHDHAMRGEPLPPGWALDADGQPTTDAQRAKAGAIAPFGEAKGYALGLGLELLVTFLARSAIGRDVVGTLDATAICNKGDVFIVIDPGADDGRAAQMSAYLQAIRRSSREAGSVSVPGDRAERSRQRNLVQGIELADEVWARISALARMRPQEVE